MALTRAARQLALSYPEGRALVEFELAAHRRLLSAPAGEARRIAYRDIYSEWPSLLERYVLRSDGVLPDALGFSDVFVDWASHWLASARALEIGCGSGAGTMALMTVCRSVVAIDVSDALLERARRRLLAGVEFLAADVTDRLPFEDASFDAVYWNDVAEHLHPEDLANALLELRRVIRSGGTLCTVTCHRDDGPHDGSAFVLSPGEPPQGVHMQEFSNRTWSAHLASAGFRPLIPLLGINAIHRAGAIALLPRLMRPLGPAALLEGSPISQRFTTARWLLGTNVVFSIAERP